MNALMDFHFIRPLWLLALLPCALLVFALWRYYRPRGSWQQVIDPELLPELTTGSFSVASRLPLIMTALAWALAIVALAGPAWEKLPQPAYQKQDALIILLDLSPSMYASDVAPSRLVQAKREIRDILKLRQEGLTALIAYAGDAHVVTPLTDDTQTIELLLPSLAPAMMPSIGNQPLRALQLAAKLAAGSPGKSARVLFVSDEIPASDFKALRKLADKHRLQIAILAIGTKAGAPIPLTRGGFLKNSRGELIVARLNNDAMESWARDIGARYRNSTYNDDDIEYLLRPGLTEDNILPEDTLTPGQQFDVWRDAGPWLALALLPLALLAFRRGWLLGLLLACMLPSTDTYAFSWSELWQTQDQQGRRALEEGEPGVAAELFEDEEWRGVARYRAGDYQGAAEAFADKDTSDAHYNRGNALARSGELEAALDAYDRALELDPDNVDAASNRERVRKALEQQQEQEQQNSQSGDDQEQGEQEQGEQDKQGDGSGEDGQDSSQQSGDQPQEPSRQDSQQDGSENDDSASDQAERQDEGEGDAGPEQEREEQAGGTGEDPGEDTPEPDQEGTKGESASQRTPEEDERLKQWLRQIPDEPGDLLQRKFDYQYRQKKRNGGGELSEERY